MSKSGSVQKPTSDCVQTTGSILFWQVGVVVVMDVPVYEVVVPVVVVVVVMVFVAVVDVSVNVVVDDVSMQVLHITLHWDWTSIA